MTWHNMKRFFGKTHLRNALIVLIFVLSASTAFAQWPDPLTGVVFNAHSGSVGNTNETYDKICDNNTGTKFCGNFVSGSGWVIVRASQPVKLSGYSLYTANDTEGNPGRNPKSWTIEGSNDCTNWTKFVTVTNNTDMGARNYKEYTFTCTAPDAYEYFRFTMTALQNGTLFQISEFHPHVYMPSATANAGYVFYSGSNYLCNSTSGVTTFNPTTCLWVGNASNIYSNASGYKLRMDSGIISNTDDGRAITLGGNESGTTGMTAYRNNNYLQYNGGWARTNSTTATGRNVAFSVTKNTYSAVEVAPTVTTTKTTFSDVDETSTYTYTYASYRPSFYDYVFYNNTNHYCLTETSNATTTPPAAETFTYTWSWESAPEAGHVTLNNTTGEVTYNNLFATDTRLRLKLTAQSTTSSKTFTVYSDEILFEAPKVDPTNVSATDMTVYVGKSQNAAVTLSPNPCYRHLEFTSANTGIATVNNTTGEVTGVSVGSTTVTVKAYKIDNTYLTTTFNVTVKGKVATPVISFVQNDSDNGTTATTTITCTTDEASIYYTTNGTTPTSESNYYTGTFPANNNVTVKAIAIKNTTGWDNSEVASNTYVRRVLPTPTILINNGSVTFTCSEPGVTFRYIAGAVPANPTPSTGTTWTEGSSPITTGITNEHTIKVIATKSGWSYSPVASRQYIQASGVSGGVVTLNDYEDHNWSYYSDPESPIKSLYPRNVKITYYGNGKVYKSNNATPSGDMVDATGVAVSKYESESTFVYYKTLERYVPITSLVEGTPQNIYPYDLIPNPFSKRPTYGSDATTKWRGFYGWRVKSISGGKIYSNVNQTGEIITGTILTTEYQKLYFLPNDAGETNANNATSMTVEFEAVWARAYRVATSVADVDVNLANTNFSTGVSYERNFLVINDGTTSTDNLTTNRPVTVMMVEPDGGTDYRANTRYINPAYVIPTNNIKFEWMNMQVSNTLSANAKNLVVGRGVLPAGASDSYPDQPLGNMSATGTNPTPTVTANRVHGLGSTTSNTNSDYSTSINYYLRLESGVYENVYYVSSSGGSRGRTSNSATLHVTGFFGNDYDRAKNNNDRMVAKEAVLEGTSNGFNNTSSRYLETMHLTMKSGIIGTNYNKEIAGGSYAPGPTNACYIAVGSTATACGMRRFIVEGGSISCITGGMETWGTYDESIKNNLMTDIRVKYNSIVRSAAFGGPANAEHFGLRRMVFTGGQVFGWVAGACNGNSDNGGQLRGATQVYVGGNAIVGDKNKTANNQITVNGSKGGNVFGAGRGRTSSTTTGEVTYGTNVVVADNAYIVSNVYGGGDLGYALETANVHVLGGEVKGSVFGGANQKKGVNANVVVRGGLIRGGVYGGCNTSGELSGNVTIQINGGQIGVSGTPANVHGGGYGQPTRVTGNVDITIGTKNTSTGETAGSAVIHGDVYGGSALGHVNGEAVSTTKHTNVTLNAGAINGNLYGGALGQKTGVNNIEANVYGPVQVTVNGGEATNVFGCNNINGRPQSTVNVLMTGGEVHECVYGGGNAAPYTGDPKVKMTGGTVNESVFGGGLGSGATITGNTHVIITGTSHIKQNVYGGGNGGLVTGNTHVDIGGE